MIFKCFAISFNLILMGCYLNASIVSLNDSENSSKEFAKLEVSLITPDSVPYLSTKDINVSLTNISEINLQDMTVQINSHYEQINTVLCSSTLYGYSTCNLVTSITSNGEESQAVAVVARYTANGQSYTITKEIILKGSFPGTVNVESLYPQNGRNWNDYIKHTDKTKTAWEQSDLACDSSIGNIKFSDCIHGGEKLEIRTGRSTCQDLTISENLGVFNWTCKVLNNQAYFVTLGLKDQKGLKDLITTAGWKSNYVEIFKGTVKILTSPVTGADSVWWNNTVVQLPDNSGSNLLYDLTNNVSGVGNIYYYNSDRNIHSYRPEAKVSIVSLNNAVLKALPTVASVCIDVFGTKSCLVSLVNNYIWLEVNMEKHESTGINTLISIYLSRFSKIINSTLKGNSGLMSGYGGIYAYGMNASTIQNTTISGFMNGFEFDAFCKRNFLNGLFLKSTGTISINVGGFSSENIFRNIFISNARTGILIDSGDTTTVQGLSINSIVNSGLYISNYNDGSNIQSVAIINSGLNNLNSALLTRENSSVFTNIAITNNTYGIVARYSSYLESKFNGVILLGNNGTNCDSDSPLSGIINGTCADSYTDGISSYTGSQSNAILRTNRTASSSFRGIVTTDDIINTIDTLGLASFASILIPNWLNLENPFRVFAPAGSSHLDTATKGACVSGNCRIFDWSLLNTDTQFRNISETGDSTDPNDVFLNNSACPSAVSGNKVTTDFRTPQQTYLTNAWELISDGVGDEDGLCESNEQCLYTPNIGAYQGNGDYYEHSCTFQDGIISGVKIYAYPNNGY